MRIKKSALTRADFPKERYTLITSDKNINLEVYAMPLTLGIHAVGFYGKAKKPFLAGSFKDKINLLADVARKTADIYAHQELMHKRRAMRKDFMHALQVGDVLVSNWGFETVFFYQVTRVVSKKSVEITPIASIVTSSGRVGPHVGRFTGEPIIKRVQSNDEVSINYGYLSPVPYTLVNNERVFKDYYATNDA